jgi:hypothetical protein
MAKKFDKETGTIDKILQGWTEAGWKWRLEENRNIHPDEVFACEVYDDNEKLPHGLGYVCGYGRTHTSAVLDAYMKIEYGNSTTR